MVVGSTVLFDALAGGIVDIARGGTAAGVGFELVVIVVGEGFGAVGEVLGLEDVIYWPFAET